MTSLDGWTIRCHGSANAAVVPKGDTGQCVRASARNATLFLSRELPLQEVRGARVEIGCLVRCEGLVPGVQVTSTAKIHLAVQTPEDVQQHSARFTESSPWQFQGFAADVPESAQRVVLNLGLEACSGETHRGPRPGTSRGSARRRVLPATLSAPDLTTHLGGVG